LGLDHPVFDQHDQLLFEEAGLTLLLDPTTAIVAIVPSYDAFFSGAAAANIVTFYRYAPALDYFVEDVYNAVKDGAYRPSYLEYFEPYPQFIAGAWEPTETAAELLMQQFQTPGGYAEAVQLGLPY